MSNWEMALKGYISRLIIQVCGRPRNFFGVPLELLGEMAGERESWASQFRSAVPTWMDHWMDGLIRLEYKMLN